MASYIIRFAVTNWHEVTDSGTKRKGLNLRTFFGEYIYLQFPFLFINTWFFSLLQVITTFSLWSFSVWLGLLYTEKKRIKSKEIFYHEALVVSHQFWFKINRIISNKVYRKISIKTVKFST